MLEVDPPPRITFAEWKNGVYFVLIHLACLGAIWTGVPTSALICCAVLYVVRMFFVTAGYHRYFSHRSFKTSRLGQLLLAVGAQTSCQRSVLWWAAHHRHHHRHSDTPEDTHSPRHHGFLWSHVGWVFAPQWDATRRDNIKDLLAYPELRWLDRWYNVPPALLALGCYLLLGWPGLIVGFFWSTVLLWHATFSINSLAHVIGTQRYDTGDDSKNHLGLALLTLGEGWHNNHHHYQTAVNQGWRWYEIDITYAILVVASWLRLVHDLKRPPRHVIEGRPHPAWTPSD